uniref:Uncharacterized protein n=1 Tax=Attheya septentrionalis TaxID=420275 RepID=A0A6T7H5Z0_9STRA|mmetsp:Transcript_19356/g.35147  ORF Transcript_19356/g.35147 Transcript_19356/m.35147 type:complete len:232 (+) Transcript_19356:67-762(+)|eukprot:CAMPEP_0198293676 /NCGR_PEP_ID=MMETSP1449-20131203/18383_1 /TAXON_ID=420275 /ORGANISM="Attheya septentrionalis, Strain CCMP2084" /LENGTH=231 /DNA_ID=CAMNT_0043993349 /DNA_START=63 /DNA_END=758 /DNA_ORIENTATION=-
MNTPATTGKPGRRSTLATTKSFRYPLFVVMAVSVLLLNSAVQARLLGNDSRHLDSVDSASSSSDMVQDEVSDSSCEEVKAQLSKDCAETTEEHVDVFSSPCEDKQLKVVFDGGSHCCPANATGTEDITGVIPETEVVYTFKEWSCDPIAEPVDKATPTGTGCEAEKLEMSQICAATTMAAVSRFKTACNHPQLKVMFDGGAHCCPPIDFVEIDEHEQLYTFKEWDCEPVEA